MLAGIPAAGKAKPRATADALGVVQLMAGSVGLELLPTSSRDAGGRRDLAASGRRGDNALPTDLADVAMVLPSSSSSGESSATDGSAAGGGVWMDAVVAALASGGLGKTAAKQGGAATTAGHTLRDDGTLHKDAAISDPPTLTRSQQ